MGMAHVGLFLGVIPMMATVGCRPEAQTGTAKQGPAPGTFFIGRELDKEIVIQKYDGLPDARFSARGEARSPLARGSRIYDMSLSPDGRWLATYMTSTTESASQCVLVDTVSMAAVSVIDKPSAVRWTSQATLSVYRYDSDRREYRRTTVSPPTWKEVDGGFVKERPTKRAFTEETRARVETAVIEADIQWPTFWRHVEFAPWWTKFEDDLSYATASANGEVIVVYGHLRDAPRSEGSGSELEDHLIVLRQDEGYEPRVLPGTFPQPKILKVWRDWVVVVARPEDGSLVRFFDLQDGKEIRRVRGDMFCAVR